MQVISQATPLIEIAQGWQDYRLIDSGDGRKLEEVAGYRFVRPESLALWSPHYGKSVWEDRHGIFVPSASVAESSISGGWQLDAKLPQQWEAQYDDIGFWVSPTPFRHFGFFPEQASHWRWCAGLIRKRLAVKSAKPPKLLNLFAYSGIASLHAARAGGHVTHVDASKKAIAAAFANRDKAGMADAPIRFLVDDAAGFVGREIRRGNRYDGIILDPPKYGRGSGGEVWKLEDDLAGLMANLSGLLSDAPLFIVLTSYALRASFLSLHHLLSGCVDKRGLGGEVTSGELALAEGRENGRAVPQAIFARWVAK